ncbi:MAG: hypothetical protein OEW97_08000 [Gammaproteobacteria bacterium]|nr:hypothetical protein [Gammaproteobacteria bacterium]
MDFSTAFKIADFAEKIGSKIHAALKDAKGHKRKILLELQENIDLIYLWKNKDFPIDKIINKLERKHYDLAVSENFNINSIKKSVLLKSTTKDVPQFQKYIGWSTEKLLDNLYRKIKQLKDIVEMDSTNTKINKSTRLDNINKNMILIIIHISH